MAAAVTCISAEGSDSNNGFDLLLYIICLAFYYQLLAALLWSYVRQKENSNCPPSQSFPSPYVSVELCNASCSILYVPRAGWKHVNWFVSFRFDGWMCVNSALQTRGRLHCQLQSMPSVSVTGCDFSSDINSIFHINWSDSHRLACLSVEWGVLCWFDRRWPELCPAVSLVPW